MKIIAITLIALMIAACNRPMTRAELETRRYYTETGLRLMEIGKPCCHTGYYR